MRVMSSDIDDVFAMIVCRRFFRLKVLLPAARRLRNEVAASLAAASDVAMF